MKEYKNDTEINEFFEYVDNVLNEAKEGAFEVYAYEITSYSEVIEIQVIFTEHLLEKYSLGSIKEFGISFSDRDERAYVIDKIKKYLINNNKNYYNTCFHDKDRDRFDSLSLNFLFIRKDIVNITCESIHTFNIENYDDEDSLEDSLVPAVECTEYTYSLKLTFKEDPEGRNFHISSENDIIQYLIEMFKKAGRYDIALSLQV